MTIGVTKVTLTYVLLQSHWDTIDIRGTDHFCTVLSGKSCVTSQDYD